MFRLFKNGKNKEKRLMYYEKLKEFYRYSVLEDYLKEMIANGETDRRNELVEVQRMLEELKKLLSFLK
jgi:hypothetical protein